MLLALRTSRHLATHVQGHVHHPDDAVLIGSARPRQRLQQGDGKLAVRPAGVRCLVRPRGSQQNTLTAQALQRHRRLAQPYVWIGSLGGRSRVAAVEQYHQALRADSGQFVGKGLAADAGGDQVVGVVAVGHQVKGGGATRRFNPASVAGKVDDDGRLGPGRLGQIVKGRENVGAGRLGAGQEVDLALRVRATTGQL